MPAYIHGFKVNVEHELTRDQKERVCKAIAEIAFETNASCRTHMIGHYTKFLSEKWTDHVREEGEDRVVCRK